MEPDASQWDGLIALGIVFLAMGVCILPRVIVEMIRQFIGRRRGGGDGDRPD